MAEERVGVEWAVQDTIGRELSRLMMQHLAAHLRRAMAEWAMANLAKTQGPSDLFAGLGLFVGPTIGELLASMTFPSVADEEAYVANWLGLLWQNIADTKARRLAEGPAGGRGHGV